MNRCDLWPWSSRLACPNGPIGVYPSHKAPMFTKRLPARLAPQALSLRSPPTYPVFQAMGPGEVLQPRCALILSTGTSPSSRDRSRQNLATDLIPHAEESRSKEADIAVRSIAKLEGYSARYLPFCFQPDLFLFLSLNF